MTRSLRILLILGLAVFAAALALRSISAAPRGDRIAFIYRTNNAAGIHLLSLDGGSRKTLVSSSAPAWLGSLSLRLPLSRQSALRPFLHPDSFSSPVYLDSGAITYRARKVGQYCEWVSRIAPGGSGRENLMCLQAGLRDEAFAWAPDGSRLAYAEDFNGTTSLYIVDETGSRLFHRTIPAQVWGLSWSPDSQRVAVTAAIGPGILVFEADGTPAELVSPAPAYGRPAWAPDGQAIAFLCFKNDLIGICSLQLDGSGFSYVEFGRDFPYIKKDLQWSPDGKRLAFVAVQPSGYNDIFLVNPDGQDLLQLTDPPAGDSDPAWSPDGASLVFSSSRDGNWELYSIRADGSGLARLTDTPGDEVEPAWVSAQP